MNLIISRQKHLWINKILTIITGGDSMELIESFKEYWAYRIEVRFRDSKDKWGRPDIYSNLYTSSTADAIVKKSNETSVCGLQFRKVADTKCWLWNLNLNLSLNLRNIKLSVFFSILAR